jgi:hypothetical protein
MPRQQRQTPGTFEKAVCSFFISLKQANRPPPLKTFVGLKSSSHGEMAVTLWGPSVPAWPWRADRKKPSNFAKTDNGQFMTSS